MTEAIRPVPVSESFASRRSTKPTPVRGPVSLPSVIAWNQDALAREREFSCEVDQGEEVSEVRVDAPVAHQSHQVDSRSPFGRVLEDGTKSVILEKRPIADRSRDAHALLIDDAACPDVLVPDFGVAHRTVGEPDRLSTRLDESGRPARLERIRHRGLREVDGVKGIMLWVGGYGPIRRGRSRPRGCERGASGLRCPCFGRVCGSTGLQDLIRRSGGDPSPELRCRAWASKQSPSCRPASDTSRLSSSFAEKFGAA